MHCFSRDMYLDRRRLVLQATLLEARLCVYVRDHGIELSKKNTCQINHQKDDPQIEPDIQLYRNNSGEKKMMGI